MRFPNDIYQVIAKKKTNQKTAVNKQAKFIFVIAKKISTQTFHLNLQLSQPQIYYPSSIVLSQISRFIVLHSKVSDQKALKLNV